MKSEEAVSLASAEAAVRKLEYKVSGHAAGCNKAEGLAPLH